MLYQSIGFYALILGLLSNFLFINVIFGIKAAYYAVIGISAAGLIVSIFGLIYDKNKFIAIVSIVFLVIPHAIWWFL